MITIIARRYAWLLSGLVFLAALSLLPPDTSLSQARRTGTLTVCVPPLNPPLVTGDPSHPGLEIEALQAIANDLDLSLSINQITAMGQDFDPSRWRITRAQCAIIGGGLVDTRQTRSYLDVTLPYLQTGLVALSVAPQDLSEARVMVLVDIANLDRLTLSQLLRRKGATILLGRTPSELLAALESGAADIAIMDALRGRQIAEAESLSTTDLPSPFNAQALVFGLWKGDLTLKRAVHRSLEKMQTDGRLATIQADYMAP